MGAAERSIAWYSWCTGAVPVSLVLHESFLPFPPTRVHHLLAEGSRLPQLLHLRLGRSSASYQIGIFEAGSDEAAAIGTFVHVYVNANFKPIKVADVVREALGPLVVDPDSGEITR